MRQLVELSKKINSSKIDQYQFEAKLHGQKLEIAENIEQSSSLSVEQEHKAEQYLRKMNQKLQGGDSGKK